jgi:hypothetical protein
MACAGHRLALDRGVGGDHAVDPGQVHDLRDPVDLLLGQVRRDLDQHRPPLAELGGQVLLRLAQGGDELPQHLLLLQVAQPGGVGRGDVDGDVVRDRVDLAQAVQVVVDGILVRGVAVLADVDAQQAGPLRRARSTLATSASTPSLLKPSRLITAWCSGSRNMRGLGLPSCGRGVTVPISTKPKPSANRASMWSPFLSMPAASPTGFGNSSPNALTGIGAADASSGLRPLR